MIENLPPNWEVAPLGDLLEPLDDGRPIHQGWSPQCESRPSRSDDEWAVLKTTAIQSGNFLPQHNKMLPTSLQPRPWLEVRNGDMLITCAGPRARCGVACLVRSTRPRLMMSGKIYRIRFNKNYLLSSYLELYFRSASAWREIDRMKTGVSDSGLNLTQARFRTLPIPVAPLAEQKRIVAAIEEHFSRVDAAEAALDSSINRIPLLLETAIHAQVHKYPTDPAPLCRFLIQRLSNGRSVPTATKGGFPVLRLTCLRDGTVDSGETKQGDFGSANPTQHLIRPNDFLISRGNGSLNLVGLGGLVPAGALPVAFPDTLIRARVDESRLRPSFVSHIWNSQLVRKQLEAQARTTAGIYKINQTMIEQVTLPVPSPDDQDKVVRNLDEFRSSVRIMERGAKRTRERIAELRRSVLTAAFAGRLVLQDPDDEPASVLLERIATSRAAKPARRRART